MWKIIGTEIRYHKIIITLTYAAGVLFLLGVVLSGVLQRMDSPMSTWSLMSVVTSA